MTDPACGEDRCASRATRFRRWFSVMGTGDSWVSARCEEHGGRPAQTVWTSEAISREEYVVESVMAS